MQYASTSCFITLNQVKINPKLSHAVPALQGYVRGALQRKQLIAFFIE